MRTSIRTAILAVVVIAMATIIALKVRDQQREGAGPRPPVTATGRPSVLLFANLSEANEGNDGCAIIIRTVRSAREHGVSVVEYDSGSASEVRKQRKVVVEPTVIILDRAGREIGRHEGEDATTIVAINADLERLTRGRA